MTLLFIILIVWLCLWAAGRQPAPRRQAVPVVHCLCCNRPATLALGDWDVCAHHYNLLTEADPALDEAWGEYWDGEL